MNKRMAKAKGRSSPYTRSRIAQAVREGLLFGNVFTATGLEWLQPQLPPLWAQWVESVHQADTIAAQQPIHSSAVLGMDIPLLQRLAQELAQNTAPEQTQLHIHSGSDTQALAWAGKGSSGQAFAVTLQDQQITNWQALQAAALTQFTRFESQLQAADATALHAAWQHFAAGMDCPKNLSQFSSQVFAPGVETGCNAQRLVCIYPIMLDWMESYSNIDTQCLWFNGMSCLVCSDTGQLLQVFGHGRD